MRRCCITQASRAASANQVQPVDDMERLAGPPYWLDLATSVRYYIVKASRRIPKRERSGSTTKRKSAMRRARISSSGRGGQPPTEARSEGEGGHGEVRSCQKGRGQTKRREAYAEAAGLMTTRAVKTLTKMKAKNVVEEMCAA